MCENKKTTNQPMIHSTEPDDEDDNSNNPELPTDAEDNSSSETVKDNGSGRFHEKLADIFQRLFS